MELDIYGWVEAAKYLPLHDVPVIVYGKGWSGMAVAYFGNALQRAKGRDYGDAWEECWRRLDGLPVKTSVHSQPVTHWTNCPPTPVL